MTHTPPSSGHPPVCTDAPDDWATLYQSEPCLHWLACVTSAPVDGCDYGRTLLSIEQYVDWYMTLGTLTPSQADTAYVYLRGRVEVALLGT